MDEDEQSQGTAAKIAAAGIAQLFAENPKAKTGAERSRKSRAKKAEEKKQQILSEQRVRYRASKFIAVASEDEIVPMASENNDDVDDDDYNDSKRSVEDFLVEGATKLESNKKARAARFQSLAAASERCDRIDEEEANGFSLAVKELQYRRIATPGPRQGGFDTPCSSVENTPISTARSTKKKAGLDPSAAPCQLGFGGVPEDEELQQDDVQLLPFVAPPVPGNLSVAPDDPSMKKCVVVLDSDLDVGLKINKLHVYPVPDDTTAIAQMQDLTIVLAGGKLVPLIGGSIGKEIDIHGKESDPADPIIAIKACGSELAVVWSNDSVRLLTYSDGRLHEVKDEQKTMHIKADSFALLPSSVVGFDKAIVNSNVHGTLHVRETKSVKLVLPKKRIGAKVASRNDSLLILAFAKVPKKKDKVTGRVYVNKDDKLVMTKRFKEGEIVDVAASQSCGFALYANGKVGYSFDYNGEAEDWSDLDSGLECKSLAAGDQYGLLASGGGFVHFLVPVKGSGTMKQCDCDLNQFGSIVAKCGGGIEKVIYMDESDGKAAFLVDVKIDSGTGDASGKEAEDAKPLAVNTD